ncbi:thioredoxin family protein [Bradyrhizobium diazoefficiens]|nr:thioredoxin [Bradyrhizobium diazoefficiens]BCF70272.1 thioredoxin [Bradyrhizobium diazoefficiens]
MKSITDATPISDVLAAPTPVLIKFEAKWCQPCKAMTPIIQEVEKDLDGKVTVFTANVEHCSLLAQRFKINQIPALVAIDNGMVTAVKTGAAKKSDILSWIDLALPSLQKS